MTQRLGQGRQAAPSRTVLESFLDALRTASPAGDVAARLGEHTAAIGNDFAQPGGGTLKGVFDTLVGTGLGLPLEAGNTVARMATGSGLAGLGAVTHGTPLQVAPNEAAYQSFMQGSRNPQASLIDVLNQANEAAAGAGGHANLVTGALNAALDPTNLVTFGGGEVAQGQKAARLAAVQEAGGTLSPELLAALRDEKLAKATDFGVAGLETMRAGEDKVALLRQSEAARQAAGVRNDAHLQGIRDQLAGLDTGRADYDTARQATTQAQDELTRVQDAFRTSKDQTLTDEYGPYVAMGKDDREEYRQLLREKKLSVVPQDLLDSLGPPPSGKDAFQAWTRQHYQTFKDREAEEASLLAKLQQALPEGALEAYQAKPATGPGVVQGGGDFEKVWQNLPDDPALAGQNPLSAVNDTMNAQMASVGAGPGIAPGTVVPSVTSPATAVPGATPPLFNPTPTAPAGTTQAIQQTAAALVNAPAPPGTNPGASGWLDFTKSLVEEMVKAQKEAMGPKATALGVKSGIGAIKAALVETPRNIIIDPIYNAILAASEKLPKGLIGKNVRLIRDNFAQGERNPLYLMGEATGDLADTGLIQAGGQPLNAKQIAEYTDGLGSNLFAKEYEAAQHLSAMGHLGAGLAATLANPLRGSVSLASLPLAYFGAMRSRAFHIINNVYHNAARSAAFSDAFRPYIKNSADELLAAAQRQGKNVAALAGRDGRFTAAEVKTALGDLFADEWGRQLEGAKQAGFSRAKQVFGNFADRGPVEQALSTFFPFMSWSWRALPRSLRMAAEHPLVSTALLHLYVADAAMAKAEGRPGYQAGTIEIGQDTPLLGLLAKVLSPDQEASIRVNPVSLFTPLSGGGFATLSEDTEGGDKNLYQTMSDISGVLGASPSPIVQGAAYLAGWDYKSPNPLSRYNAVDQLVGDVTNHALDVPTIQGALRAGREAITGEKDTFDPVRNKANELVFERTGVPVSDSRNKEYAKQIARKEGIYQEAQVVLDKSGALRAGFNAVTPVTAQVTTATTAARQQASQGLPHSYADIQAAKAAGNGDQAALMEIDNLLYQQDNPAAAVNVRPSLTRQDTQDERLTAFERQNAYLKAHAPAFYAQQLAAYKASIGIR